MSEEKIVGIAKAYKSGKPDSDIIVIPKKAQEHIGETKGRRFLVKVDEEGRIIYEPIS